MATSGSHPTTPPPTMAESFYFGSQATTVVRLSPGPSFLDHKQEDMYRNEEDIQLQKSIEQGIVQSIEEGGDVDMMIQAQLSPCSNSSDEDQQMRGGAQKRSEYEATAYRPSEGYGEDYYGEEDEFEGSAEWQRKIDEMDDDDDDDDEDAHSTSSDWDNYGSLPVIVGDYEEVLARIEGSDDWNADQKKLHKLIYLRGLHPMIPSHWRLCFKMWGVTAPILDDVFTPKSSRKRTAIRAYGSVQHAGKALESLFYLSQHVTDNEELELQEKSAPMVARTLRNYYKWAVRDCGLDPHKNIPVVLVKDYQTTFGQEGEADSQDSISTSSDSGMELSEKRGDEDQEMQRFARALDKDLEMRLRRLGRQWHDALWDQKRQQYIAPLPTLYGLAVVQHIVGVVSLDPNSAKNSVVVLEQVKLNDRGQWLWNALSLALPINLARDALYNLRNTGVVHADQPDVSDPDL